MTLHLEVGTLIKKYLTDCLSVTETAQALGLCKTKVYALLRDGALPHLRIGRRILIPCSVLDAWVEEHITAPSVRGEEQ